MDAATPERGSVLKAALMGGALGAVLQATPYVNDANMCCCALVVACGLFAAWVLQSDASGAAGTGRCGLAGLLSGLFAGVVGIPLGAVVMRLAFGVGELEQRVAEMMNVVRGAMQGSGPTPPGFEETMEAAMRSTMGLDVGALTVAAALFTGVVFSFFGLLGGLLGGVLMDKSRRAPDGLPPAPPGAPPFHPVANGSAPRGGPFHAATPPPPPAGSAQLPVEEHDDGPGTTAEDQPELPWSPVGAPPATETVDSDAADSIADPGRGPLAPEELPLLPSQTKEPDQHDS